MSNAPTFPSPGRFGDFVQAAGLLMHASVDDVLHGVRPADRAARAAVAWTVRMGRDVTLPQIGNALGSRNADTVRDLVRLAEKRRETDAEFRALTTLMLAVFNTITREG